MVHIILTGATGTAGAAVLARCIASSTITRVSVLSRRPVKQAAGADKVNVIIHNDFNTYPESLLGKLKGAVGCVWALGVASGQVGASEYKVITYDYPLAATKAFATLNSKFNFVYVSGEGTTRKPGRLTSLFARTKGAAESSLLSLIPAHTSLRIYNVRPGAIDDSGAKLKEGSKSVMYNVIDKTMPLVRAVWPNGVSPTGKLAEVLLKCVEEEGGSQEVKKAFEGKGVTWEGGGDADKVAILIENIGIRRLAGL